MTEAVMSLKKYGEANKWLEQENEKLKAEIENLAGHRNPNQKI